MIHFSCDRCHRTIETQDEFRFVVRLQVHAALDAGIPGEEVADRDYLEEVDSSLTDPEMAEETMAHQLRYDLCPGCYQAFMENPLGERQQDRRSVLDWNQN